MSVSNNNRVTSIPIGLAQSIKNSHGISTKNTSLIKNNFTIIPMTIEVNKEYIFNMNDLVFLKLGFKQVRGVVHIIFIQKDLLTLLEFCLILREKR